MAEKVGWKLVLQWEQNAIVPILDMKENNNDFEKTLKFFTNYLPEDKREEAKIKI